MDTKWMWIVIAGCGAAAAAPEDTTAPAGPGVWEVSRYLCEGERGDGTVIIGQVSPGFTTFHAVHKSDDQPSWEIEDDLTIRDDGTIEKYCGRDETLEVVVSVLYLDE